MSKESRNALIASLVIVVVGIALAWAGSQGGSVRFGIPLFVLAVGLIFAVQWIAFIPAYLRQTEKFFDITGSLTYISVTVLALVLSTEIDNRSILLTVEIDSRSILLTVLVVVWAVRLGIFLFRRVHKAGKDGRFDDLKPDFWRFLNAWTLQGLWVALTASAALVAITTSTRKPLGWFTLAGTMVWVIGFAIEVVADAQKSAFRADSANKGRFINTGMWARSRHPNYFGEIMLWLGIAVIALPVLQGWQWVALISPVFVTLLLTRISGIPMLEKRADARWGGEPDYEEYKLNTPVLILRLW